MFKWQGPHRYLLITLVLIMIFGTIASATAEVEPVTPAISIDQAISMALTNSDALKKASNTITLNQNTRDTNATNLSFAPTEPAYTAAVEAPYYTLLTSDLTLQMSKKSLTSAQDGVALTTCNEYWSILKYQEKVKLAELGLKIAYQQMLNGQVSNRVGMLDESGLLALETAYKNAQATLTASQNDLDKAFITFNQAVGLEPADRPTLTDTVEYSPIKVDNLDSEVAKILANSPTVWLAEQSVKMQNLVKDMAFYSGSYQNYESREIQVQQVQLSESTTRKSVEQATRTAYYSLKTMEDSYVTALEKIEIAENNLRIIKIKYELGMTTSADVTSYEKALADAQNSAFELKINHEYSKIAFEKPWAAS